MHVLSTFKTTTVHHLLYELVYLLDCKTTVLAGFNGQSHEERKGALWAFSIKDTASERLHGTADSSSSSCRVSDMELRKNNPRLSVSQFSLWPLSSRFHSPKRNAEGIYTRYVSLCPSVRLGQTCGPSRRQLRMDN